MSKKDEKINLTESLKKLSDIATWFDDQENVDVEVGLVKVREATQLIKDSKGRLAEIENEFREIEKEISDDVKQLEKKSVKEENIDLDEDVSPEDIPF